MIKTISMVSTFLLLISFHGPLQADDFDGIDCVSLREFAQSFGEQISPKQHANLKGVSFSKDMKASERKAVEQKPQIRLANQPILHQIQLNQNSFFFKFPF